MADRFGDKPAPNRGRIEESAPETAFDDRQSLARGARALVLHPFLKGDADGRDPDAGLEEACGLADAIDLNVVSSFWRSPSRTMMTTTSSPG